MKRLSLIGLLLCVSLFAYCEQQDTAVWNGFNLKVDLATPVLEAAMSKGCVQSYEVMMSAGFCHKFYYPALELGYAQAEATTGRGHFFGLGGFGRIGLDISALRKGNNDNKLFVGLRVGTAIQQHTTDKLYLPHSYWQGEQRIDYPARLRCDVWGEVVAGVQVKVYKSFHMGWYVRLKILMTRNEDKLTAYYIPGYGYRQDTNFGINYYLGWTF